MALRVALLVERGPLWLDESWLANNVVQRSFGGLLHPLDFQQVAPIPFLWAEHLLVTLAGPGEMVLRLLPFLAGFGTVVMVWKLAERVLAGPGVGLALALAAFSPLLVRYGAELKPYALDAFFSALMTLLAIDLVREPSRRRWWMLALCGGLAVLSVTPGIFIALGISAALVVESRLGSWRSRLRRLSLLGLLWGGLFLVQYVTIYRVSVAGMTAAWSVVGDPGASPIGKLLVGLRALWIQTFFGGEVGTWLPTRTVTALALLSALGGLYVARRRLSSALLLGAPAAVMVAASLLGRWPLSPRLMLLAVPPALVLAAGGIAALSALRPLYGRAVAVGLGVSLLVATVLGGGSEAFYPAHAANVPGALAELERRSAPGSTVYVFAHAWPVCAFYTSARGDPVWCRIPGRHAIKGKFPGPDDEAWARTEAERIVRFSPGLIWLLFPYQGGEDLQLVEARLRSRGARPIDGWRGEGARLILYDTRVGLDPRRPAPQTDGEAADGPHRTPEVP